MCCRDRLTDTYKEYSGLRTCLHITVSFCVLVWLSGLVVGPILLLRGHCDEYPTVNQTQVYKINECIKVLDNACRGTLVITGYFDATCDDKNYTGVTHLICFTQACIKSEGIVKVVTERNYYSSEPSWMWWIIPGLMVYLWWAPVIFIAILITKHLIHKFFVGAEERLEEVAVEVMSKYTSTSNIDSSDDEDSTAIPLVMDDLVAPRLRPLTPPLVKNKKTFKQSVTKIKRNSAKRSSYPDHRLLLEKEIKHSVVHNGYPSAVTSEDDLTARQSDKNILFNEIYSGPGTDGGYSTNVPDLLDEF